MDPEKPNCYQLAPFRITCRKFVITISYRKLSARKGGINAKKKRLTAVNRVRQTAAAQVVTIVILLLLLRGAKRDVGREFHVEVCNKKN